MLPRETELGLSLGVSRTVVREALMLLEEDGLINTKRGVGRFVAESIPHQKLGEFQPLEDLLADAENPVTVELVEFSRQATTDFVSENLALPADAMFWFRECILTQSGERVALVQEYLPDQQRLTSLNKSVGVALTDAGAEPSTLLKALTTRFGQVFTAGNCSVAASVAGPTRAQHLGLKAADPLLVLTQTALLGDTPAYISKSALAPAFGHLAISQWKPAGA